MRDGGILKTKRVAAGILGMMMLIVVLFSAFCIAAETEHDCTGAECPVCIRIQQCENILHQFGNGATVQASMVLPMVIFLLLVLPVACNLTQETPVSRKIRLNN